MKEIKPEITDAEMLKMLDKAKANIGIAKSNLDFEAGHGKKDGVLSTKYVLYLEETIDIMSCMITSLALGDRESNYNSLKSLAEKTGDFFTVENDVETIEDLLPNSED